MNEVTVVVATRDRQPELARSLPRHEAPVIVVDNGSTDDTVDVASGHGHVQVVRLPGNRGAAARTIGARAAATPFVAFADDDSWWSPGSLSVGVGLLERHPEIALLNARIVVGPHERLDPISLTMEQSPLDGHVAGDGLGPRILGFVACASIVRRDAFLAVGGFDDVVRFPGEEQRVALDLTTAGWELRYAPDLVVHHHPSPGRDPAERRRAVVRSQILTALMRRPWRRATAQMAAAWREGGASRAGARAALSDAPLALRARRPIPHDVEAQLRLLERTDESSCSACIRHGTGG